MADWVSKRVQFVEEYARQTDGDRVYRLFPWQHVVFDGQGFLEPVDYPDDGIFLGTDKEITSYEIVDAHSQFVPGNVGTGGNVGILRG